MSIRHPRGIILLATLLSLMLFTLLLLTVQQRISNRVRVGHDLKGQLYSLALAANGVELARAVLPALDLNQILATGGSAGPLRNPLSRSVALGLELSKLDALFSSLPGPALDTGSGIWTAPGRGRVLLRLTNNPEEPPDIDADGVIVLRSMGVVQTAGWPLLPGVRNCVSVVEARLRQERLFALPAPILLFGTTARVTAVGDGFQVVGIDSPPIGVVSTRRSDLAQGLADSLRDHEANLLGTRPFVQDLSDDYQASTPLARIFDVSFWSHLEQELPRFAFESDSRGFRFLPEGGTLSGRLEGVLIARGPLTLQGSARVNGLLIHLGNRPLECRDQARVLGGIWMTDGAHLKEADPPPLELILGEEAQVIYDRGEIERALWLFPPTQLGWRVISTEMDGG